MSIKNVHFAAESELTRVLNEIIITVNNQQRKIDEYDKELTILLEMVQDLSGATDEDIMNVGNGDFDS